MSSFGTAFLQTTADAANKRFSEKTAEENKVKDEQRKMYWNIAYDTSGQYNDAQKSAALEQYNKLVPASLRKPSQKFNQIFGTLTQAAKAHAATQDGQQPGAQPSPANKLPGPSTPPPSPSSATLAAPPGGGAMTTQPPASLSGPQTPKPSPAATPQLTGPKTPPPQPAQGGVPIQTDADMQTRADAASAAQTKRELAKTKEEQDFWTEQGKKLLGADASPRDLAEYAGSKGTKLPPVAAVKMTPTMLQMKDGETIQSMRSPDGKYYDLRGNLMDPDAIKAETGKPSSAMPRFSGQDITLESAKAQAKAGQKFNGIDGSEISLEDLPPNMVLQPLTMGGKVLFLPVDPAQTHITVGNEVIATDKYHMKDIASGGGTDLGVARTGSTNTPTQVVRDNEGVPHVLGSTTQPNTPGPKTAAPPAQSKPAGPGPSPRGQIGSPATPAPGGGARAAMGVTPGMDKDYLQTARSVQQALTQVVGDDSNPNLKTVVSLAPDVLKDPKKTERVGKAIRMMLGGDSGLEGAHVQAGASVGPVSIGLGGFGSFLTQSLNMDAKVAAKINENLKAAMKDMTPEEKNLVDATVAAFEESIAMRSINKSGVSNAQVGAIQNTLPLIGANTFSVDEFATRMQNWAQQGLNGTWGVPAQYFRKGFIDKLKSVSDDMEKLRSKSSPSPKSKDAMGGGPQTPKPGDLPKPSTKGAKLSVDDAAKYLQAAGGDKAKAKKMAGDDGWTF